MQQTSRDVASKRNRRGAIAFVAVFFMTALMLPSITRAQSDGNSPRNHPRVQEARHVRRAACSSKSAGTTCSFPLGNQTFTGICEDVGQGQMACRNTVSKRGLDRSDVAPEGGMSAGDLPR